MRSGLLALLVCVVACGSDSTSTGIDTSLKLGGSWSGTLNNTATSGLSVKWTATQTGSTATGPVTLIQVATANNQAFSLSGTMDVVISGTQAAVTLTLPPGTFTSLGGPQACKGTGTGTSTPTATSLSSSIAITWDASCVGTVVDKTTETDVLTLTKQ